MQKALFDCFMASTFSLFSLSLPLSLPLSLSLNFSFLFVQQQQQQWRRWAFFYSELRPKIELLQMSFVDRTIKREGKKFK